MGHPYEEGVGTVEEDFKSLGLDPQITMEALESELPEPGTYTPNPENRGRGEVDHRNKKLDEARQDEHEADEPEDDLDEGAKVVRRRPRRGAKAAKQRRQRRKSYKGKRAKIKAKRKKMRKTAKFKRRQKIRRRIKAKKGPLGKGRALVVTGMDRAANLSEQIDSIVAGVSGELTEENQFMLEYIESMDLSALIADVMADRFAEAGEDENAEAMDKLADAALEMAEKMESGKIETDEVEEKVKSILGGIASAMEAYDDLDLEEDEPEPDEGTPDGDDVDEEGN